MKKHRPKNRFHARMIDFKALVKAQTAKSILIHLQGDDIWLPKSQIGTWPSTKQIGTVTIPEWMAIRHKLHHQLVEMPQHEWKRCSNR